MASAHRRNNAMGRIKVNGEWLVEEQEVKEGIVNSFQQLLTEDMVWQADIGIFSAQNAFVMGRQILDASLIANEVLQRWALGTSGWDGCGAVYLLPKFSILVNGVPAGFFPSTRGLRQGDPLSPYLFVMGMEILDVLIRRAVEGASKDQVSHLSWILFWFEAASGLRMNLAKSEIIPVGEVEEILELAAELGCRVGSLPSHYLGSPLGVPIGLLLCGMEWKRGSGGDLRFGKDSIFPKGGGSLL
ncbi:hypothetical protein CK203_001560 [Vitis vinifera]|uniref:Reverse transcriptase domain-containing protein n=1 Tax=Vitis vinifera TaxID=29760 RepID=A0A438KM47_VITVI|nr:hypothetical protein CK203_001560 [Vitis vinifera]